MNKIENLSLKAGDIIATQTDLTSSRFIRVVTLSKWSHVGIAVNETHILEAVKENDSSAGSLLQIRVVPIAQFVANKSKMRHFIRPGNLSFDQLAKLRNFANSNSRNGYTAMHAALTVVVPFMRIAFVIFAIYSTVSLWNFAPPAQRMLPWFIAALAAINLIIYLL